MSLNSRPLLLLGAALALLVACGGDSEADVEATVEARLAEERASAITLEAAPTPTSIPTSTPIPTPVPTLIAKAEELYNPGATEPAKANPPQEAQIPVQQNAVMGKEQAIFWNHRQPGFPDCTSDFKFSHHLANPEDVVTMFFGLGGHIEPHEHMLYWQSQPAGNITSAIGETRHFSEKIQLYAPADIYRVDLGYANKTTNDGEKYVEWGGYLYTCNGHQLMLGHIGEPSEEMLAVLAETQPTCGLLSSYNPEPGCTWLLDTFIPSGTPIFRNSGYTGAFDFGLSLFGLTSKELQEQPGYGYSITPWRVGSGRAVCPTEYFPEPVRSEYRKRLYNNMTGELLECGPFNQDVPGTAMGFWLPSPSPATPPMDPSEAFVDEWETIWLYEANNDPSVHVLRVGNNTFGLDYGDYRIATVSEGLVNRRWDAIKPRNVYCSEFKGVENEVPILPTEKILVMELSGDGLVLTVEALPSDTCGLGPWIFQGGERTFYR